VVRLEAGVEFLGYRITGWKVDPSAKAVKRLQEKVRSLVGSRNSDIKSSRNSGTSLTSPGGGSP
jgi:hypothetical protein